MTDLTTATPPEAQALIDAQMVVAGTVAATAAAASELLLANRQLMAAHAIVGDALTAIGDRAGQMGAITSDECARILAVMNARMADARVRVEREHREYMRTMEG